MHTILLGDYLTAGGQLPDEFQNQIFTDMGIDIPALFTGKYIDREIGYETPELFYTKLCTRAGIVFPRYADKFAMLAKIDIINAEETEVKDGNYTRNADTTYGHKNTLSRYSNPYASTPADDGSLSGHDTNEESGKDNVFETVTQNDMRTRKSGLNTEAALRVFEGIENDKVNIINDFLNEFENCFLQVF